MTQHLNSSNSNSNIMNKREVYWEEKKKETLQILKERQKTQYEISTTEIAVKIGMIQYRAKTLLEELEIEGKIQKVLSGRSTYWRLKDGKHK